jgi:polyphosphate kinase
MNKKVKKRKSASSSKIPSKMGSKKQLFLNRELGWLEFNQRVLSLSQNPSVPLLERVKFLSIVNSNLDEFFMKRVGGLKRALEGQSPYLSSDGLSPQEELRFIRARVLKMIQEQGRTFNRILKPALKKHGIFLKKWDELSNKDKKYLVEYFRKMIFPVLTPLVVDPAHPFPFISNLSTSLGVRLEHPKDKTLHFARVKVPEMLDQWVELPPRKDDSRVFVSLVELIQENLDELFPGMKIISVTPFRITRNIDLGKDPEDAEDLLEHVAQELHERKFADVVRIEHGPKYDAETLKILKEELKFSDEDVYQVPEQWDIDYCGLKTFNKIQDPSLRYPEFHPSLPSAFRYSTSEELFSRIKSSDVLLHHPYESFQDSVVKWIELASEDPKVLAIKITLYRTEENSPIIQSLKRALDNGKQVVVLIELQARFDEQRNILWAKELEDVGAHVCYGIVGLKIHTKLCLIVRRESDQVRSYAHIGTGNYNSVTSKAYTDLSLFTARDEITSEVREVFNYLTGMSLKKDFEYLLVAPLNLANRIEFYIQREESHAREGRPSHIIAKMNNFEESRISRCLYSASQWGVKIDMIIRGFCCLRPGREGLSQRISVRSILGRFLEHSRIYYFRNGQEDPTKGDFFIGSADWMYRNLYSRVECLVPILDPHLKNELWALLEMLLDSDIEYWSMRSSGKYIRKGKSEYSESLHAKLIDRYQERERIWRETTEEGVE